MEYSGIEGPTYWYGPEKEKDQDAWLWHFTEVEIDELTRATKQVIRNGIAPADLNVEDFPLPTLGTKLNQLQHNLILGHGFGLLRGFPVHQYSVEEAAILFYGLGTHLGHARSQNAQGHLLGHVRNTGLESTNPNVRIYQTKERQTFHTDSTDVVGLLCLQPAQEGGRSLLVSADTVYNEMLRQRPDLLQLLCQPIATDRRGEVPEGMEPFLRIPVFTHYQGRVTIFYQRQYIESAQRFAEAPRLTAQHVEALNLFDAICNDPSIHLTMMLEKGDMQFVYNHAMLHDRTAFVDWPEPDRRRHLLRLWLSVPNDRPLHPIFASRFGSVTVGDRGGIVVSGTKLHIPSTPSG
ncbi:MAG: TauD/TfdA family dioxygenase [Saprospiraceae bacterium]|nr:TauD/TfdA family dioxygenase [Saprospiraceae bacterium]